ncbi:AraC family transcriptional regulator [Tropicimonas sp. TH_r6]|uniref:AraC family transcriptional regulator n=1 Tax=Tropicimonas sp. TH_r6 TaxID=3082085 RepID=UPI00295411F2|nr:AraC family transcriptional regulator [Tropicimonas sp. TH_r6]MDV7143862.1 AraC family transcriptional regulator [Tropicimonas sp. TH_r6]
MAGPTLIASMAASLVDFAVRHGASEPSLLQASGISKADLRNPDGRIPADAYLDLIDAAVDATGDTGLAMRHAAETSIGRVSVVGLIVEVAGPLEEAIRHLNRYTRIVADLPVAGGADRFELREEGGARWLIDHFPGAEIAPVGIEETFANLTMGFRKAAPGREFALEVQVSFSPPPHRALYDEIFRAPVRFNAGRNAIRLNPAWLEENTLAPQPYAFGLFSRHADTLLAELEGGETTRARVEALILPELHKGSISMDAVARDLGMSRQTLYRRLKDENATFAEVHDDLRQNMARGYLTARKISVTEVAYLLGFSEASSFVRAFKRWTGQSPAAFRQAHDG